MAGSDRLYFRADDDLQERVGTFEETHGFEDQSKATRELVEIGLREVSSPLVYRFKDQLIRYVGELGLFAVLSILAGFATPLLSVGDAALLSISLVVTSVTLLAVLELVRTYAGCNQLGRSIRERFTTGDNS